MGKFFDNLQPWAVLLLRLVLGVAMLFNGWDKVVPHGGFHGNNTFSAIEHWNGFILQLGMPAWLGTISAFTEFFGGIFLILGFLTRLSAFLVAINMSVAILKVNIHHGYPGSAYSLALLVIAIAVISFGAGMLAVDRRLGMS